MDMSEDQIKQVIDSCRKRLGKPVKGNKKKVEDNQTASSCCDTKQLTKGFGK